MKKSNIVKVGVALSATCAAILSIDNIKQTKRASAAEAELEAVKAEAEAAKAEAEAAKAEAKSAKAEAEAAKAEAKSNDFFGRLSSCDDSDFPTIETDSDDFEERFENHLKNTADRLVTVADKWMTRIEAKAAKKAAKAEAKAAKKAAKAEA